MDGCSTPLRGGTGPGLMFAGRAHALDTILALAREICSSNGATQVLARGAKCHGVIGSS